MTQDTKENIISKKLKWKCFQMHRMEYRLKLAIGQAFIFGEKNTSVSSGTNKTTASNHVLSLLVKNEECIETATSTL